jgi:GNAT superfamily N-acetyltransferase
VSASAPTAERAAVAYFEPARSYVTTLVLLVLIVAGFLFDLVVLGGGAIHAVGWAIAAVVVVGADGLAVRAARARRSILVTGTELRVGATALDRSAIVAVEREVDRMLPVLGRGPGEGRPRSGGGLVVRTDGGAGLLVPTRHPARLAAVLAASFAVPDIRPVEADEHALLAEIDQRADTLFRVAGLDLPPIPFPLDTMHEARAILVAGRPPVGFVQVDEVDGLAHVAELAVLPSHMRRGLGSALLEAACAWAIGAGYPAITVSTFADVDWNAPFYRARGFVVLSQLTPELTELRAWEHDVGLDQVGRRVVLRREL